MTKEERLAALKTLKTHLDKRIYEERPDGRRIIPVYIPEEILQEASAGTGGYVYASDFWEHNKAACLLIGLRGDVAIAFEKAGNWVSSEIAKIEQPPIDPKEIIEAAAADGAGMDAAESKVDREQMRKEIMGQVTDFTSAIRHLYKALDAGYAKDEEIAALKKEVNQLKAASINREAIIDTLKHQVKLLKEKLNAAEPRADQPAPVRLPAHGDVIEARYNKNSDWEKVEVYADSPENPRFIMGSLSIKACQETYDKGIWRWPEPRTRTAADAQVGDPVWVSHNGSIVNGTVEDCDAGNLTVWIDVHFTDGPDKTHGYDYASFGVLWGYAEEETK